MHSNHGKESQSELSMLKPMLSDKEKEDRQTMSFASPSGSAVAKGIKRKCDVLLTRQNIKNMGLNDKVNCNTDTLKKDLSKTNDAEGCRDLLLHSYGAKVILLKAIEGEEGCAPVLQYDVSSTSSSNSGNPGTQSRGALDGDEEDVMKWVNETKSSLSLQNKHLICLAWTTTEMRQLALAFPFSLCVDATHKACSIDGLSLFTVTVKDSFGNTHVVLRIWIPNQKLWMFKYVLHSVIPEVFGSDFCKNVRAIVSDGDPQLIKMIDNAIFKIYTNAVRQPCCWHIVDRPMQKLKKKFAPKHHTSSYFVEWLCRFLQSWLYSWMKPSAGINCREEYEISKAILLSFLDSPALQSKFHSTGIQEIKEYVLGIIAQEKCYLAFLRMTLFNMEVYTNCGHEATNHAVKYMTNPVTPTDSLGTAIDKIAAHDVLLMYERQNMGSRFRPINNMGLRFTPIINMGISYVRAHKLTKIWVQKYGLKNRGIFVPIN
jgi:hypothetical protein